MTSRASKRPPKLEPKAAVSRPATPPTPEQALERARVAGPGGSGPGPTELRRSVERLTTGDRRSLGELAPMPGLTAADAWAAVTAAFGATPTNPAIDPSRTSAATREAVERVRAVAASGSRVAFVTANPASLLTVHLGLVRLARDAGAEVVDLADFGPIRADGRTSRTLRWVGGVAVVSDGKALCHTSDGEAAREWMFAIPRPALVVADGPFAEVAWESGVEVVAFAGLERLGLAVAAARAGRCTLVPMRTDRPTRNYAAIEALIEASISVPISAPIEVPPALPEADLAHPPSPPIGGM
jgi:hypothetical protein